MKNLFLTALMIISLSFAADAQRIAIIDINNVLEGLTEYAEAQTQLDKVAADWRQEIAQEYDKIKSMYNKYQAEQVLLSDDVKKQREDEIIAKENEVRELQKRRFGPEGDLFKKRQEMVSPIQDAVFAAIEDFAADRGYDIILDKSGASGLLFSSDEFDKTEEIRKRLR